MARRMPLRMRANTANLVAEQLGLQILILGEASARCRIERVQVDQASKLRLLAHDCQQQSLDLGRAVHSAIDEPRDSRARLHGPAHLLRQTLTSLLHAAGAALRLGEGRRRRRCLSTLPARGRRTSTTTKRD